MQVYVVRSSEPGCEPYCQTWIAAQGRVDASTPRLFKKALAEAGARQLPIVIDSAGGTVDESLAIGRLIRAKGLTVTVGKTLLETCTAGDKSCRNAKERRGRVDTGLSKCASSCAFILAGGAQRLVGPTALVGVHQITSFETRIKVLRTYRVETRHDQGRPVEVRRTLVSEKRIAEKTTQVPTSTTTYKQIRGYFSEMGIGEGVMAVLLTTPSSDIHWLSRAELQATRLATETSASTKPADAAPRPAATQAVQRE